MKDVQTTTKGFAILSIASIINKFFSIIYVPVLTLIVGNYGNGIINSGYTIYILMYGLSNAGIPVAISKLVSERIALDDYMNSQRILKAASVIMITFGLVFGATLALSAHWISIHYCHEPKTYLMLLAISPALCFTSISSIFRGYFQGRLNMIPTGVSQIIEQGINSLLTIVFAAIFIKYGIEKAAAGTTIGTSVGAMGAAVFLLITFLLNKNEISKDMEDPGYPENTISYKTIVKQILSYSFPAVLGIIAMNLNNIIDLNLCSQRLMSAGFNQTQATELYGILTSQYQKLLNMPLAAMSALPAALIPSLGTALARKDTVQFERKVNESFRISLIIALPSAVGLAVLAKPVITFVFFNNNQGSDLMQIGSWLIIINAIIYVQNAILISIGKPYFPPINLIIGMIFKTIMNYFLIGIPYINIKGAIISSAIGYLIACILNQVTIAKHTSIKSNFKSLMIKPIICSAIMGIAAFGVNFIICFLLKDIIKHNILRNDIAVLISIAIGAFLYLHLLLQLRVINSNDISKLPLGNKINIFLIRLRYFDR